MCVRARKLPSTSWKPTGGAAAESTMSSLYFVSHALIYFNPSHLFEHVKHPAFFFFSNHNL